MTRDPSSVVRAAHAVNKQQHAMPAGYESLIVQQRQFNRFTEGRHIDNMVHN